MRAKVRRLLWSRVTRAAWFGACLLPVGVPIGRPQDLLTYHNDIARTGQDLAETILAPNNVNSTSFGKLFTISVDGKVDAQPLYVSQVAIPGQGTHNLLIVVTEHDSAYGFDADTGSQIWKVSMLQSGETASDDRSCSQVTPEIGITATPVIDRTRGPSGAIYLVAMSKNSGNYFQRLHALDLTTGAELFEGPVNVQATYPGTGDSSSGGVVTFVPGQYKERPGLLLMNGTVYTAWGSHCDSQPYTGWVMGYDAGTLAQTSVLNVVPNGGEGGIWMAGAGLAADNSGNIFVLDGNGDFDTTLNGSGAPANGNYGNAFLKISTAGGLAVADYFEMDNESSENGSDTDLGSGGALVLPDQTDGAGTVWHLAVGAGKDGNLYLVNRDSMGKFSSNNNNIYQELAGALPGGIWSMPAYFNGTIYYGPVGSPLYAFQFSNAQLSTSPVAQTSKSFGYPGTIPSISANTGSNGIVWAAESTNPAVLHAYNAMNLAELYNSNQAASGRDHFGAGNKFIAPAIANGKVYVGTTTGVGVFGLLESAPLAPTGLSAGSVGGGIHSCDFNNDGTVNVQDVQLAIDMALGLSTCTANIDGAGVCNVIVVQRVINTALGGPCVTGPGVTSSSVSLSWTASISSTASGYNVYRASAQGGPYTKLTSSPITATTYTDNTAQAGNSYYYATTAVDASNNESAYSAAVQSVVPSS
jgi:hypothetical protein